MCQNCKKICKIIADNFAPPCIYDFDGIPDTMDFIDNNENFCDDNCSYSAENHYEPCWERFFKLMEDVQDDARTEP